jgi:hypothetical protein
MHVAQRSRKPHLAFFFLHFVELALFVGTSAALQCNEDERAISSYSQSSRRQRHPAPGLQLCWLSALALSGACLQEMARRVGEAQS